MSRPTRAEMRAMADDCDNGATHAMEAARDGDRAAKDPANSPLTQKQAAMAAHWARQHSREYREDAEALRDGRLPGEDR